MNIKEVKKLYKLPSALGKSVTYFVPVANTDEYMHMYESDANGVTASKYIADVTNNVYSMAIVDHPIEITNNTEWKLRLISDPKINITSFDVRITAPGYYKRITGASSVKLKDDYGDNTLLTVTVYPKDILGTRYKPIYSVVYITEANDPSNMLIMGDALIHQGDPIDLEVYNTPSDVEFLEVRVNEGSPLIFPGDTDVISVLPPDSAEDIRVVVRPQKYNGDYYDRLYYTGRQIVQTIHPISGITATPVPDGTADAGESVTIEITPIDPNITSWTIRVGNRVIDVVPNNGTITFNIPMEADGLIGIHLIPNSTEYGVCDELHVVYDVTPSMFNSGGIIVPSNDPIEDNVFRYKIKGTNPSIKSFKVVLNGVPQPDIGSAVSQLPVSGSAGTEFNLVVTPIGSLRYQPIYYSTTILPKKTVKYSGVVKYNEVNHNEPYTIELVDDYNMDGYKLELSGALSGVYQQAGKVFNLPKPDALGIISFVLTPFSTKMNYIPYVGTITVVGIEDGYAMTPLPNTKMEGVDIGVTITTLQPDIIGYNYSVNGTVYPLTLDANGNGLIDSDNIPTYPSELMIIPITNSGIIYATKSTTIVTEDSEVSSSGLILVNDNFMFTNSTIEVQTTGLYAVTDRFEININGAISMVYELPDSISFTSTSSGFGFISVTPYYQGNKYATVGRVIQVIDNPVGYENTDAGVIDSGITLNINDTVAKFDSISVDIDQDTVNPDVDHFTYYLNADPVVVTSSTSFTTKPLVSYPVGSYVKLLIVPISKTGITYEYLEKDVQIIGGEGLDSEAEVLLPEEVPRRGKYEAIVSSPNNDVSHYVFSASNSIVDVTETSVFKSEQVNDAVGSVLQLIITPISLTGKIYSTLTRTIRVVDSETVESGIQLFAPTTVQQYDNLNITWSEINNDDVSSVVLTLTDSTSNATSTYVYGPEITNHLISNVTLAPSSSLIITLAPVSKSNVKYFNSQCTVNILSAPIKTADLSFNTKPPYNIGSGTELNFIFNNDLSPSEIEKVELIIKDSDGTVIETTYLPYDVKTYSKTIYGDKDDKGTFTFTPIGVAINGNTADRYSYTKLTYGYIINTIPIPLDNNFSIDPEEIYAGWRTEILLENNDINATSGKVYLDDLLLSDDLEFLNPTTIRVLIPQTVEQGTSELRVYLDDPSGRGIVYEPLVNSYSTIPVNLETPAVILPSNNETNVALFSSITIGGYKTNGNVTALFLVGKLYEAPIDGSEPYSVVEEINTLVPQSYQTNDTQTDVVYDPLGSDTLRYDHKYKFVYHYDIGMPAGVMPTVAKTLEFTTTSPSLDITYTIDSDNIYVGSRVIITLSHNDINASSGSVYLNDRLIADPVAFASSTELQVLIPQDTEEGEGVLKVYLRDPVDGTIDYPPITNVYNIIPINKEIGDIIVPTQDETEVNIASSIVIPGYKTNGKLKALLINGTLWGAPIDGSGIFHIEEELGEFVSQTEVSTNTQPDYVYDPFAGINMEYKYRYKFTYKYVVNTPTGFVDTETKSITFITTDS